MDDKELPDVQWGDVLDGAVDKLAELEDDSELDDDDDELLPETPADVIDILGFDPLELDQD